MKKRSVNILGHQTSITLEDEFWDELKGIARSKNISMNMLIAQIDAQKRSKNLSSALRLFVLGELKQP